MFYGLGLSGFKGFRLGLSHLVPRGDVKQLWIQRLACALLWVAGCCEEHTCQSMRVLYEKAGPSFPQKVHAKSLLKYNGHKDDGRL